MTIPPDVQAILERAIKTFAQTLVAALVVDGVVAFGDVAWVPVLSAAGLAGLLSVLTSMASWRTGPTDGPSLVGESLPVEDLPDRAASVTTTRIAGWPPKPAPPADPEDGPESAEPPPDLERGE